MVPRKAPVVGFGGAMAGLPVWVAEKRRIKKQRDGQALALGGHRSITITNNQPVVDGSGRGYVWVDVRLRSTVSFAQKDLVFLGYEK